ncbi:MAG: hypothetical protein ABIH08_07750, partial [Candidatus Omnitrophota bacterium]
MVNRLKELSPQFKKVLKVSSLLADSLGFKVYLVGGVVRDLILGKEVFDLDIVVEGDAITFARKLAQILKTSFNRHQAFGTAAVSFNGHKIDFATARTEHYTHWGALPKVSPATLEQDLSRRDFTINAMAISLNKASYGKLIDLHNSLSDLHKGLLRVMRKKSFLEDPTRILRAIRFEQRFSFKVEQQTFKLMREALAMDALRLVTLHRLRDEIIIILKEPKPYRYIKRIKELAGFSFIDSKLKLNKDSLKLILRIEGIIRRYGKKYKKHEATQVWLIYLAAMLINLSQSRIAKVFHEFGFRRGEREAVSIKKGLYKIKKINKSVGLAVIYRGLKPYSIESIIFFYAYYPLKILRRNIDYFLDELKDTDLRVRG